MTTVNGTEGILAGMRLVEVSAFVAAPLGGMTLAQMGAEVIRLDLPTGGLDYRRWPVTNDNVSLFWAGLNKAKRSVTIDFTKPEGRELAQALITAEGEYAGMLLTNMPPKGWLSYESLCEKREDMIQLTIKGTRNGESAVDYTINPKVGIPSITGPEGHEGVVNHVLPAWDLITGQTAAVGLLAAERHRRLSGKGRHVSLALEDVALASVANLGFTAEAELGQERERVGNDLFGAFGRDFVTADGHRVMVVGLTGKQWSGLCKATGIVERINELSEKLGVNLRLEGERFKARNEIAALITPWVASRSLAEVATAFDEHKVCWSKYQTVKEMVEHDPACSTANPLFKKVDQYGVGEVLVPAVPLDFGTDQLSAQPAPRLGADTDEVLSAVLGLASGEIGALHDKGLL